MTTAEVETQIIEMKRASLTFQQRLVDSQGMNLLLWGKCPYCLCGHIKNEADCAS